MATLGERSLSRPKRNFKRWNETGTGIMLFKAQADRGPIGDDLRAFRSESDMESMRAVLSCIRCKRRASITIPALELSATKRWDLHFSDAYLQWKGEFLPHAHLGGCYKTPTHCRSSSWTSNSKLQIACQKQAGVGLFLGNIIGLWKLWMIRFASSMSTFCLPDEDS